MEPMPVPESCIAKVVSDASSKMHDPQYISSEVDRFIGRQTAISQLVMASSGDLTVEGVVTVLFHAALLAESITQNRKIAPPTLAMTDLDRAANATKNLEALSKDEPHLASYIASNVDDGPSGFSVEEAQTLLAQITRALLG